MRDGFDWAVVGSGFGGSVAALRLAEKGYRVLVLEQGRRFSPRTLPRSTWQLPRWLWLPALGWRGPFQMRFLRHVTVVAGVGVGGGSIVYGNTLPSPPRAFFTEGSWARLADWERELEPHYRTALAMLGAAPNRELGPADRALQAAARALGCAAGFGPNRIGVYQGEPGRTVPDPYFGGAGPLRTGCVRCGGCFLGCRYGAKNTLDRNYLWLAERRGARILANTRVTAVRPHPGGEGWLIEARRRLGPLRTVPLCVRAGGVVLAAGVLGTLELLLRMQADPRGLPRLSPRLGYGVRTNSESLLAITSRRTDLDLSRGVAIGSLLQLDERTHAEPCRYPRGSGFFRAMVLPHAPGSNVGSRLRAMAGRLAAQPGRHLGALLARDWARQTLILLCMQATEGTLRLRLGRSAATGWRLGLLSELDAGAPPSASLPAATRLAELLAEQLDGVPVALAPEALFGVPTTAHILGGACMGAGPDEGVIDSEHRVFGYERLLVVDGAAVSANPGVNPSLTIAALAERAMARIPARGASA